MFEEKERDRETSSLTNTEKEIERKTDKNGRNSSLEREGLSRRECKPKE
jgi:hypothetical protein